jgi:hypothetical protein
MPRFVADSIGADAAAHPFFCRSAAIAIAEDAQRSPPSSAGRTPGRSDSGK